MTPLPNIEADFVVIRLTVWPCDFMKIEQRLAVLCQSQTLGYRNFVALVEPMRLDRRRLIFDMQNENAPLLILPPLPNV